MASIINRKNGTYGVKYYLDGEVKWGGTCKTEKEAMKLKKRIEREIEENTHIAPTQKTVEEFALDWIEVYGKTHWNAKTFNSTSSMVKLHIIGEIGHLKMSLVTPREIELMLNRLVDKKVNNYLKDSNGEKKTISRTMVRYIHMLTKQMFDKAVEWQVIALNPVRIEAPKRDTPEQAFWSSTEVSIALNHITEKDLHLAVHIAFACSLRIGEVLGITWDNIDFEKKILSVEKILQRISISAYKKTRKDQIYKIFPVKEANSTSILVLKDPKTKSSVRTVYIPDPLIEELKQRQYAIGCDKANQEEMYEDNNLVFSLNDGTPIEPNLCSKKFRKWQEKNNEDLGLTKIKFHGLRHSSTTYKLKLSGGNVKAVQADTGITTAKLVTDTYSHCEDSEQYKLAQSFQEKFYGAGDNNILGEVVDELHKNSMNSSVSTLDEKSLVKEIFKKNPLLHQEILIELLSLNNTVFK